MIPTGSITKLYFDWMCDLIGDEKDVGEYTELLHFLFSIEFTYMIFMDKNRYQDGLSLRYRFANDLDINIDEVHEEIDEPCSVLEMMIALAVRCEENLMTNTEYGNRTGYWFWKMVDSLGLSYMTDKYFDIDECEFVMYRFLERDYDRTGAGGLFTVRGANADLREVEIWMQMNWYISQMM